MICSEKSHRLELLRTSLPFLSDTLLLQPYLHCSGSLGISLVIYIFFTDLLKSNMLGHNDKL
jgi:hypothetical protein